MTDGIAINLSLTDDEDRLFVVYAHGHNGDFTFCELWDCVETREQAEALGRKVMEEERPKNLRADGTPTIQWVEIFGPGINESIGIEEQDGVIVVTGQEGG